MRFTGMIIAQEIQEALDKGASYKEIKQLADNLIFETTALKRYLRPKNVDDERLKNLAKKIAEVGK